MKLSEMKECPTCTGMITRDKKHRAATCIIVLKHMLADAIQKMTRYREERDHYREKYMEAQTKEEE